MKGAVEKHLKKCSLNYIEKADLEVFPSNSSECTEIVEVVKNEKSNQAGLESSPSHSMILDLYTQADFSINNDNLIDNLLFSLGDLSASWLKDFRAELELFKSHVYNGTLYEAMKKPFFENLDSEISFNNYKRNLSPKKTIVKYYDLLIEGKETEQTKYLKTNFLAVLNAKEDIAKFKRVRDVFESMFPIISSINKKIKKLDGTIQNSLFSHLVLQLESYLVLDVVCKEFKEKHPQCKLLTIHDCIITTEEYKDMLRTFMEKRISEILGIRINTKQKPLSNNCLAKTA